MNDRFQRASFALVGITVLSMINGCNHPTPETAASGTVPYDQCKKIIKVVNEKTTLIDNFTFKELNSSWMLQLDLQSKQRKEKEKQYRGQLLKVLDARIKAVEAVELSDPQLKKLQTQLVQVYIQNRQAIGKEPPESPSLEEPKEEFDKKIQQSEKQTQQSRDSESKVQAANSALNKYCGLE